MFCLSIHPLVDIWAVSGFLAIVHNAAVNLHVESTELLSEFSLNSVIVRKKRNIDL